MKFQGTQILWKKNKLKGGFFFLAVKIPLQMLRNFKGHFFQVRTMSLSIRTGEEPKFLPKIQNNLYNYSYIGWRPSVIN